VLVVRLHGCLERARPAKPLKLRRDLGVIHIWIVAAARADELERAGVAALDAALCDAGWLAPHECRAAMAGLPDKRECDPDYGARAQPRVTAIVQTRRRDGGRAVTASGTGNRGRAITIAHSTHRQDRNSCAAGI
jgi:hypothetical protein